MLKLLFGTNFVSILNSHIFDSDAHENKQIKGSYHWFLFYLGNSENKRKKKKKKKDFFA